MERYSAFFNSVKIDIRGEVIYITMGNHEYYIDDSTNEQYVTVTNLDDRSMRIAEWEDDDV